MTRTINLAAIGAVLNLSASTVDADVVVVVPAESDVEALSKYEVTNLFLGKTRRFPDDTAAVPVDQAEGSAARDHFYRTVAGKSAHQVKAHWSKLIFTGRGRPPKAVENGEAVKAFLAENPDAIGYLDRSLVDDSVRVVEVK